MDPANQSTPNPIPPVISPHMEDVPPPPPLPAEPVSPPSPVAPPPPIIPPEMPAAPPPPPPKKWGKGALVGSIAAIFLIVASVVTGLTLYQRRNQPVAPTAPKQSKAFSGIKQSTFTQPDTNNYYNFVDNCFTQHLDEATVVNLYQCPGKTENDPEWTTACNTNVQSLLGQSVCFSSTFCGVQQIDIHGPNWTTDRLKVLSGVDCVTPSPSPSPSASPVTSFQCQQVKVFRGGVEIQTSDIKLGDTIVFRGFASSTAATAPKLRFTLTKGGVAQTPVDKDTTLVGALYQADYQITVDQATSYSATAVAISP